MDDYCGAVWGWGCVKYEQEKWREEYEYEPFLNTLTRNIYRIVNKSLIRFLGLLLLFIKVISSLGCLGGSVS